MIVYDGISLDSVANVKVEDIRISPIQYDEVTRPRAIRGGSVFIRSRAGIRTVAITFALLDRDPIRRQSALMGISAWAKNDREYRLEVPGQPEFFLMAICGNGGKANSALYSPAMKTLSGTRRRKSPLPAEQLRWSWVTLNR